MPLLSSCSDDDENGSAIEGYWVTAWKVKVRQR